MHIFIYLLLLIITFYLISFISDKYFVQSLEKISQKLKLSSEVTGATFMAVGSSAPELFTSIFTIFAIFGSGGNSNIGSGTIVGSAIFNILVIVGLSLFFSKSNQQLSWKPIIRDLLFYVLTIGLLIFSFWDGVVTLWESGIFVVLYICYVYAVSQWGKWFNYSSDEHLEDHKENIPNQLEIILQKICKSIIPNIEKYYWGTFLVSIALIGLLSHQMVKSAVELSYLLNIPKTIIGLTILAAGTSVPDAISSVIVAKKNKVDMAITNALGSNIFDILFGLGAVYFVYFLIYRTQSEIQIDNANLTSSVFLLLATVLLILCVLILKKWKTNKNIGIFLLCVYALYLGYAIFRIIVS